MGCHLCGLGESTASAKLKSAIRGTSWAMKPVWATFTTRSKKSLMEPRKALGGQAAATELRSK